MSYVPTIKENLANERALELGFPERIERSGEHCLYTDSAGRQLLVAMDSGELHYFPAVDNAPPYAVGNMRGDADAQLTTINVLREQIG